MATSTSVVHDVYDVMYQTMLETNDPQVFVGIMHFIQAMQLANNSHLIRLLAILKDEGDDIEYVRKYITLCSLLSENVSEIIVHKGHAFDVLNRFAKYVPSNEYVYTIRISYALLSSHTYHQGTLAFVFESGACNSSYISGLRLNDVTSSYRIETDVIIDYRRDSYLKCVYKAYSILYQDVLPKISHAFKIRITHIHEVEVHVIPPDEDAQCPFDY